MSLHKEMMKINRMLKRFNRKIELIQINISSSFMARARCPSCGEGPSYYIYQRNPYLYFDSKSKQFASNYYKDFIKRITADWYLRDKPSDFQDLSFLKFALKDYLTPTLHRTRGNPTERNNVMEMVCCDCGSTAWSFKQKAVKDKPEITNRKGRYQYPQTFDW
jgi:hypothetical protein